MRDEVEAEVYVGSEYNDDGRLQDCTFARCTRCDHEVMSWGDGPASARRSLAQLNNECPLGQDNWYDG